MKTPWIAYAYFEAPSTRSPFLFSDINKHRQRAWACACVKAQHDSLDLKCISMPMATRRVAALWFIKQARCLSRFLSLSGTVSAASQILCSMPLVVYLMSMQLGEKILLGKYLTASDHALKQLSSLYCTARFLYFHALNALANVRFTHWVKT